MTRIILVMKRPGNVRVISDALTPLGAACVAVSDRLSLEAVLAEGDTPEAALVDVSDFGPGVAPICELLRRRRLPFIALSPPNVTPAVWRTLTGAMHCLYKPVGKGLLQQIVQNVIETVSDGEPRRARGGGIQCLQTI